MFQGDPGHATGPWLRKRWPRRHPFKSGCADFGGPKIVGSSQIPKTNQTFRQISSAILSAIQVSWITTTYRGQGKRRVSLTVVDHFWTLKSTEYWVVSQVTFIVPPPLGLLSIAIAS